MLCGVWIQQLQPLHRSFTNKLALNFHMLTSILNWRKDLSLALSKAQSCAICSFTEAPQSHCVTIGEVYSAVGGATTIETDRVLTTPRQLQHASWTIGTLCKWENPQHKITACLGTHPCSLAGAFLMGDGPLCLYETLASTDLRHTQQTKSIKQGNHSTSGYLPMEDYRQGIFLPALIPQRSPHNW